MVKKFVILFTRQKYFKQSLTEGFCLDILTFLVLSDKFSLQINHLTKI